MSEAMETAPLVVVDFSSLPMKDLNYMVRQLVIGRTLLVRNLLALKRAGFPEIAIQYRIEQDTLRRDLLRHPILKRMLTWHPSTKTNPMNAALLERASRSGCYWVHPLFFARRHLLPAMEKSRTSNPENNWAPATGGYGFLWLTPAFLKEFSESQHTDPVSMLRAQKDPLKMLEDPRATGLLVQNYLDAEDMEKALLSDSASTKRAPLRNFLHKPFSLWFVNRLSRIDAPPNALTALRLLLGILSPLLVMRGAAEGSYAATALGAGVFYSLEFLDEIDGELARLNLRESARGARFDRITDRISWSLFLCATFFAAYEKLHIPYPSFSILFVGSALLSMASVFLYGALAAWMHFEQFSYALFRRQFIDKIPREHAWTKMFFFMRNLATRDLLVALLALCVGFDQSEMIVYGFFVGSLATIASFIYFARQYPALLPKRSPGKGAAGETSPATPATTKAAG